MDITLRKLSVDDGREIYDMLQVLEADENGFTNPVHGMSFEQYKAWLISANESAVRVGEDEEGNVPETTFWLYEGDRPVGYGKIRLFLTEELRRKGGNIGYALIPAARGKGIGVKFAELLLAEGRKMGVKEILFTIRNHNLPSIRIARACGAALDTVTGERHYFTVFFS